jgi:hypothetical protein
MFFKFMTNNNNRYSTLALEERFGQKSDEILSTFGQRSDKNLDQIRTKFGRNSDEIRRPRDFTSEI